MKKRLLLLIGIVALLLCSVVSAEIILTDDNVDSYVGKTIIDINAVVDIDSNRLNMKPYEVFNYKASGGCVNYVCARHWEKLKITYGVNGSTGNGRDCASRHINGKQMTSMETGITYTIRTYFNDAGANIKENSWVSFETSTSGYEKYGHVVFVEYVKTDANGIKQIYYTENVNAGVLKKASLEKFVGGNLSSWATTYLGTACYESESNNTVTYNANGGTGAPTSQTASKGSTITLSSAIPTRSGYTFMGWSTSSSASTASHYPGSAYTVNGDVTLYAVWSTASGWTNWSDWSTTNPGVAAYRQVESKTQYGYYHYILTWSDVVGAYPINNSTMMANGFSSASEVYHEHWSDSVLDDVTATDGQLFYQVNGASKVYKKYPNLCCTISGVRVSSIAHHLYDMAKTRTVYRSRTAMYTVNFNANGGSVSTSSENVTYGSTYGTLPTPTRSGHTFDGWYTSASGGSMITSSSTVSITSNQTLYAHWTPYQYTVTYNANGGSGAPAAQTKIHDITLTLSNTVPTRDGYTFLGWWSSSPNDSAVYSAGASYTINESATLYAEWQAILPGKPIIKLEKTSYYTDETIKCTWDAVSNCEYYEVYIRDETGFAIFIRHEYYGTQYSFNMGAGSFSIDVYAVNKEQEGTKSESIYFTVTPRPTYTITYNANGGNNPPASQTKTYGTALTLSSSYPIRTGYIFQGWATSATGSVVYGAGASYTTNANVTLYAVWSPANLTVYFNANGGTTPTSSKVVTYTSTYGTLPTPTRSGHTFDGWYTSASGGSKITSSSTVSITSNQTLYAHWTPYQYTVTYNANGGSNPPAPQTKTHGSTLILSSTIPTRAGYTFKGWAISANGNVVYLPEDAYTANENLTLYAVWEITSTGGPVVYRFDTQEKADKYIVPDVSRSEYSIVNIDGINALEMIATVEDPNVTFCNFEIPISDYKYIIFKVKPTSGDSGNSWLFHCPDNGSPDGDYSQGIGEWSEGDSDKWITFVQKLASLPENAQIYTGCRFDFYNNTDVNIGDTMYLEYVAYCADAEQVNEFLGNEYENDGEPMVYKFDSQAALNSYIKRDFNTSNELVSINGKNALKITSLANDSGIVMDGFKVPISQYKYVAAKIKPMAQRRDGLMLFHLFDNAFVSGNTPYQMIGDWDADETGRWNLVLKEITEIPEDAFLYTGCRFDVYSSNAAENGDVTYLDYIAFFTDLEQAKEYLKAEMCVISYNDNGGEGGPLEQVDLCDNGIVITSTVPARDGYTFKGWATTADGEAVYYPGDIYSNNDEITLYAVWEENILYGDISGNGIVDVSDVIKILQLLANGGFSNLDVKQKIAIDVNGNGDVDVSDAIRILQYLASPSISLNPNS